MDDLNNNISGDATTPQAVGLGSSIQSSVSVSPVADIVLRPRGGPRWLWWVLAVCGVAVVAFGVWYYYAVISFVPPTVAISFIPSAKIFVGDPFVGTLSVKNESNDLLKNVVLTLSLPDGISLVGQSPDGRSFTYAFPDIGSGGSATVTSTFLATENPASVSNLSMQVAYGIASSSKQFAMSATADVAIGPPAVGLTIAAPPNAVSGSTAQITLGYMNETSDTLPPSTLVLDYPPDFNLETSSAPVSIGDVAWPLGALAPGASGTVTVDGIIGGTASATTYGFGVAFDEALSGEIYAVAGPTANVAVVPAPLVVSVVANNSSSYVSAAYDWLSYALAYADNANAPFTGVVITAKLTGAMFDFSTLQTNGSFDSTNDTLTWSPSAVPALATLAPGQSGTVTFRVRTLPRRIPTQASDKDYSLLVAAKIFSPSVLPGVAAASTTFATNFATKVGGSIAVAASGYRYDATPGVVNAGPYPPIVNETTTYAIHWTVTPALTDMGNVVVSATLPPGVSFTGAMWSNVSSTPQYNPATGAVTWQIPSLAATAGAIGSAPETVFQVADTPAVNQVGQVVDLLGETTVVASDTFTGNTVTASADAITSDLPNDSTASAAAHGSAAVRAQ